MAFEHQERHILKVSKEVTVMCLKALANIRLQSLRNPTQYPPAADSKQLFPE
jgi:hypothetical protein